MVKGIGGNDTKDVQGQCRATKTTLNHNSKSEGMSPYTEGIGPEPEAQKP